MPRSKKANKAKRKIGKPAVRKGSSQAPRSIPDLSKVKNISNHNGTPSPLNTTPTTNLGSARMASEGAAGPSYLPLQTEAPLNVGPSAAPLSTGVSGELSYSSLAPGLLVGSGSASVAQNAVLPAVPNFTSDIEAEAAPIEPVTESDGGEKPENKMLSTYENKPKEQRMETDAGVSPVLRSPARRSRKPPTRFNITEPEPERRKKSIFEGISRDTLQKYMAFYNIPKRQDLKKNLVTRVQAHFDTIDHKDIDLEELTIGVRARLHKLNTEGPRKRKR